MAKRMYISKRHLYCELQARNNSKLWLKKPPVRLGYIHLRMCTPQVFGLSEHVMEIVPKREKNINEEEKKDRKRSVAELMRRIFEAEQHSMDLARGDYLMHYEGGRLLL